MGKDGEIVQSTKGKSLVTIISLGLGETTMGISGRKSLNGMNGKEAQYKSRWAEAVRSSDQRGQVETRKAACLQCKIALGEPC